VSAALAAEARVETAARLAAARLRLRESRERARVARDSLQPAARRLREGAMRLYESGRSGILPVFDALRGERDTAQLLIQELLAFQEARADLIALLGRWE
jgi:outer membrane protein TolC